MAETRFRFGAQSSADVKLILTGPGEKKYEKNPVYLHSQILRRLKGFEGKFPNRWSPGNIATELRVTTSLNFNHYLKCIEILYGEPVGFPNVEECLEILSVAFEMSSDECINKCMQYLEAVRWSAEEESQIRRLLCFEGLKLKISPDLAARLHQDDEDDEDINFVEKTVQQMVSLLKGNNSALSVSREIVQKDLTRMLDGNTSRDVLDVCERVLLQELKESLDSCNIDDVKFLINLIQHCNGGILEASIRAFCEEAKFLKFVNLYPLQLFLNEPVFDIITWFMEATGDGKIIISRDSRVSFLTTWLPIMGKMSYKASLENRSGKLDRAVLNVVESLPQVDQKRICLLWAEVYASNGIDITTPFTLSQRLLKAPSNFAAKNFESNWSVSYLSLATQVWPRFGSPQEVL